MTADDKVSNAEWAWLNDFVRKSPGILKPGATRSIVNTVSGEEFSGTTYWECYAAARKLHGER